MGESARVIVEDGVVHLWGLVGSESERRALTALAHEVPGVSDAAYDDLAELDLRSGTMPPSTVNESCMALTAPLRLRTKRKKHDKGPARRLPPQVASMISPPGIGCRDCCDKIDASWSLNSHAMPWKLPHYYVDSLATQNGGAYHRGRERRSSGLVV